MIRVWSNIECSQVAGHCPSQAGPSVLRVIGETDAEGLARYGIDEWPEGAIFCDIWPDELKV